MLLDKIRQRARDRGLPFNITPDDLLPWPTHCPVLGVPLRYDNPRTRAGDSPSVDRFNNDAGYVRGNVRVISQRANLLKNSATAEELRAVLAYVERPQTA